MLVRSIVLAAFLLVPVSALADEDVAAVRAQADQWRAEHRLIDMHQHIDFTPEHLARAVRIMDAAGIGIAINLGTGTVTPGPHGEPSEFERNRKLADTLAPGRILHYMLLDYHGWDDPDWSDKAVKQIEEGHRLGAAGLKEFKRLGLYLRDGKGKLLRIDDPRLDPVWEKCGELHMPISIHVADPKAFWEPYNEHNERWKELKNHRLWWFGDKTRYPGWKDLLEALDRVIARHPHTTFVAVHFANNAEELDWVDQSLAKYPNKMADLAARIPEIGRHDPEAVRALFMKYQDRILLGTDFMVYDRLILGSSGDEPPPTDQDAQVFYQKHWRWLETRDRDWPHMTPIQGNWKISSIGLPASVLRKIYFDNARRLLARSLPLPTLKAAHTQEDFALDADLNKPVWQSAQPVRIEYLMKDGTPRPELSAAVRCLWSSQYLYVSFDCPFTSLTVFDDVRAAGAPKRMGLWDRDVVEVFCGSDDAHPNHYGEFEVAPTNERLDVFCKLPDKDFGWDSKFASATKVDEASHRWRAELRIPLTSLSATPPKPGDRWRINLFRSHRAGNAFMAWNPTLTGSTHTPEKFGFLEFEKAWQ